MSRLPVRLNDLKTPMIVAHRGVSSRYPENTLAAFEAAVKCGAAMIELDVSLTRDRQIVVIHDDTLGRTTSGTGRVCEKTFSEIRKLDAGSWFDPRFAAQKVPLLEEVLERFGRRCAINIEIKFASVESPAPEDAVEKQVLRLIDKFGLGDSVVVSSFHTDVLARIRRMNSHLAVGVLSDGRLDSDIRECLVRLNAFSWNPNFRKLSVEQVARAHGSRVRVIPYTVNGVQHIRQALAMGVDGMFTDDPVQALRVVNTNQRKWIRE